MKLRVDITLRQEEEDNSTAVDQRAIEFDFDCSYQSRDLLQYLKKIQNELIRMIDIADTPE